MLRRGLVWAVALLARASFALTSQSITAANLTGTAEYLTSGGTTILVRMTVNIPYSSSRSSELFEWHCTQLGTYVNGQYNDFGTPRTLVGSVSTTPPKAGYVIDCLGAWSGAVAAKTLDYQVGHYRWYLTDQYPSGTIIGQYTFDMDVPIYNPSGSGTIPGGYDPTYDTQTAANTSAIAGSSATTASNTGSMLSILTDFHSSSYWESLGGTVLSYLFIPATDENTMLLKDAVMHLTSWGPFGMYSVLNGEMTSGMYTSPGYTFMDATSDPDEHKLTIPFTFLGNSVPIVLDFTPYWTYITFMRNIMAGVLWWLALQRLWSRAYAKV